MISNALTVARLHVGAVVLAVTVGVLTGMPQLIAQARLGDTYRGIQKEVNGDEIYYMARAQEVVDGHPTIANPYFYESKNEPPLQVWIPEAVLSTVGATIFGDVRTGKVAWDFVLPGILVLLTYAIFLHLTRDRLASIGFTTLLSVGLYLQVFGRSPSPQLNFIFMLLSFLFFYKTVTDKRRLWILASALSLGSLFYVYTYYWTYAVVLLGLTIVGCFVLFNREGIHWRLVTALLGGGILGLPYLVNLREASALPHHFESLARVGMIVTHSPSGLRIVAICGIGVALYFLLWRLRWIPFTPLSLTLALTSLAGIVAVNHHIITGLNLEFSTHYHWVSLYGNAFALGYAGVLTFERFMNRQRTQLRTAIFVAIVAFSVVYAAPAEWRQTLVTPAFAEQQRYAPVLRWLHANTDIDDVVYADDELSYLVSAYTHNNVMMHPNAMLHIVPQADVRKRFLLQHYFDEVFTRETIIPMYREVYGNSYIERWNHTKSLNKLRALIRLDPIVIDEFPEDDIPKLVQEWYEMKKKPFLEAASNYRIDYIAWDRTLHPHWNLDTMSGFEKIYDEGNIAVFSIKK